MKSNLVVILGLLILGSVAAESGRGGGREREPGHSTERPRPSEDASSNSNDGTVTKRQRIGLEESAGFEDADISVRLNIDPTRNKKAIGRFVGKVVVAIPTDGIGITTADDAENAKLHYVFSRNGVDYADCTLRFDGDEDDLNDEDNPQAEYKLDLELKKGGKSVRSRKGRCDVNLTTTGVQTGIPAIATGDVVRAEAVISGGRVRFAETDL